MNAVGLALGERATKSTYF